MTEVLDSPGVRVVRRELAGRMVEISVFVVARYK